MPCRGKPCLAEWSHHTWWCGSSRARVSSSEVEAGAGGSPGKWVIFRLPYQNIFLNYDHASLHASPPARSMPGPAQSRRLSAPAQHDAIRRLSAKATMTTQGHGGAVPLQLPLALPEHLCYYMNMHPSIPRPLPSPALPPRSPFSPPALTYPNPPQPAPVLLGYFWGTFGVLLWSPLTREAPRRGKSVLSRRG